MANTENPRQQAKKPNEGSVQAYLEIAEIRDDVLVMKDGSLRSVLMVSSVNFELKSVEEQEAIVAGYQNFINSLNFPIQILIRSKRLVLDPYMYRINERIKEEESPFIKNQLEQYKGFIKSLLEVSNVMDKEFYVIVPMFSNPLETGAQKVGFIQKIASSLNPTWAKTKKEEEFQVHKAQLSERVALVMDGLSTMELNAAQLSTLDLIELFYEIYNMETAQREKLIDTDEITSDVVR